MYEVNRETLKAFIADLRELEARYPTVQLGLSCGCCSYAVECGGVEGERDRDGEFVLYWRDSDGFQSERIGP